MENKNIIAVLIIIIAILAVIMGAMLMPSLNAQKDSKITITSNKTLYEGDNFTVKLTDMNGTGIADQTVNITIIDDDGTKSRKSIVTDSHGRGVLEIDENPGNYTINCTYGGNDNFTANSTKQKLEIKEIVVEEPVEVEETTVSSESESYSAQEDNRPAVDSGGITREEADYWGWEYTTDHGGHYIGVNDHWDEKAGVYHD